MQTTILSPVVVYKLFDVSKVDNLRNKRRKEDQKRKNRAFTLKSIVINQSFELKL